MHERVDRVRSPLPHPHAAERRLAVAPRTVAAHVEHLLLKLDASSRTLAAVRAERDSCYVPTSRAPRPATAAVP